MIMKFPKLNWDLINFPIEQKQKSNFDLFYNRKLILESNKHWSNNDWNSAHGDCFWIVFDFIDERKSFKNQFESF